MKTDDLVAALAADARARERPIGLALALALICGAAASLILFCAFIGPRPDALEALRTARFELKFIVSLAWATPSFLLCVHLARPQAGPGALLAWLVAPLLLLAAAVGGELALAPRAEWGARLVGVNWRHCLTLIPLLALAPLAALILALRSGAPRYPGLIGALAGAAAAGIAATLYAANCTDDSPLFVAAWYPLATMIVAGLGALAGRRWLRW